MDDFVELGHDLSRIVSAGAVIMAAWRVRLKRARLSGSTGSNESKERLFVAKCNERIDLRRAPRRYGAGCERDGREQDCDGRERQRVEGADAEQQVLHEPSQRERGHKTDAHADQRQDVPLRSTSERTSRGCASEREAYADLPRLLHDEVRQDAIDAERSEHKREDCERAR